MAVLGIVARHELVEVAALERIFFEGEVFVGAQVVNPELQMPVRLRTPGFLGSWFAVKEKDIRLDALGVEDAGGQTEQGVNVRLFE